MQPVPEFDSTGNAIDRGYPLSSKALQIYTTAVRNGSTTMKYMNFDDLQKLGQHNVDTAMKLSGEWNKGLQAIAAEMTDYTKRSFEESAATFEKLLSAKSVAQAIEIQTGFAKRAYDSYLHQCRRSAACTPSSQRSLTSPLRMHCRRRADRRYANWSMPMISNQRTMQAAMTISRTALVGLLALGTATSASAQSRPSFQPSSPPRPPVTMINPINPFNQGPPPQPDRAYVAPRSGAAPPMERVPQVAPLAPRID
jgi:Phasin protein